MARIRIMIAEDDHRFQRMLEEVLKTDAALEVVAVATDAREAVELAQSQRPDVALVDVRMPAGGGIRATELMRESSPATRVIALSATTDRTVVLDMLRAGAVGYIVKGAPIADILGAVHRCTRGEVSIAGEVADDVMEELSSRLERQRRLQDELAQREERMRAALEGGGPKTLFQPIVRLGDGEVVGAEALARFDGEPSPGTWFGEAETVGLRTELELLAARAAARAAARGLPADTWVSLNASPDTALSTGRLLSALRSVGPKRVLLEITEQAEVEDYDRLNEALDRLRAAGVRIAVDDAGAGYASLRHILRLEPDVIKLDRTLVMGIHSDRALRALATALISFAGEIGAQIVAEGIETARELEALRELGAELGQGYHLARPQLLPLAGGSALVPTA